MKYLVVIFSLLLATSAYATNTPCSGKKGGVAYCSGTSYVCKDGSISSSKSKCDPEKYGVSNGKKQATPIKKK